jgi:hypothetical protein
LQAASLGVDQNVRLIKAVCRRLLSVSRHRGERRVRIHGTTSQTTTELTLGCSREWCRWLAVREHLRVHARKEGMYPIPSEVPQVTLL